LPITGDVPKDHLLRKNRRMEKEMKELKEDISYLAKELKEQLEENEELIRGNYENFC